MSIAIMSKYIGLYKPWGFKDNAYILFCTSVPQKHYKTITDKYQRLDDDFRAATPRIRARKSSSTR